MYDENKSNYPIAEGVNHMGNVQNRKMKSDTEKNEPDLKGTFISVMLIGVFLIVSWVGIYTLFMVR